jgi:hypothetical protein
MGACLHGQHVSDLSGLIRDPSGAAIPHAGVSVVQDETGFRRSASSLSNGGYLIASLQPGSYKVTVKKEGFQTLVQFGVKLDVAQPTRLDFTLPIGSMHETITIVSPPAEMHSTEDASVGTLVGRDWIERLPLNGRGLLSLMELAPGAVVTPATHGEPGQFSVNGQRPNSNYFTVDGISVNTGVSGGGLPAQVTGGSLPGMTAFGSYHGLVSLEALEEFRVQTSSAVSEFGRLPGAQVSLSTRAGSNELHGSFYYYFRNKAADANDWFANRLGVPRQPLGLNNPGATLGGPLRKNRTFFFLSYEDMHIRQPFAWRTALPSTQFRNSAASWAQPIMSLFPQPNGPVLTPALTEWTGVNSRASSLHAGSIRLDHALTSSITLFGRYNEAPSSSEFGMIETNRISIRSRSVTGGVNALIRPNLIQDFRFNYLYSSAGSTWALADGNTIAPCYLRSVTFTLTFTDICESFFRFSIAGVAQLAAGRESDHEQRQWNVVETMSWHKGSHQFRFGADYRRLMPLRRSNGWSVNGIAESLDSMVTGRGLWIAIVRPDEVRSILQDVSLFAQDTWMISPRLTLSYGFRWDLNPAPKTSLPLYGLNSPAPGFGKALSQPIWDLRYTDFAPRAGFAYRLNRSGRTVLRAGMGIYFDSTMSVGADLVNGGPFNVTVYNNPASLGASLVSMVLGYGFDPNLRSPLVWQWNVSLEHAVTNNDTLAVRYIGSAGRHLLRREMGEPQGTGGTVRFVLATNQGRSDYQGMHFEYRRRLSERLQGSTSYAWGHAIDNSSSDSALYYVGSGLNAASDRGNADFDARHTFNATVTYERKRWAIDGIVRARTGFPVNVVNAETNTGIAFANVFRPDVVPGKAVWIDSASEPGGKSLNPAAFAVATGPAQGNLGRNAIEGFGMWQLDLAVRREFSFRNERKIELRLETFNLSNHPNLADPLRYLNSPLFGKSSSMLDLMLGSGSPGSGLTPMMQTGGPRSFQAVFRFRF